MELTKNKESDGLIRKRPRRGWPAIPSSPRISNTSHRVVFADRPDALEDHRDLELHLRPRVMAVAGLEDGRCSGRSRTLCAYGSAISSRGS
jgi:hypothetical protein